MYQCWSLQCQCSHMYPRGEILGRYFGLLRSHCRSWVSWVGEMVVRGTFCKSLYKCPQQSQEPPALFHALLCSLSASVQVLSSLLKSYDVRSRLLGSAQGQTPAESDGATHIFLLVRQGKPGLLLGFWEQCSDAGLELLLGSSPARLSLARGASPSHPDTPSLTFPRQLLTDFPPLCCKARGQGWQAAGIQPDLPGLLPFL